MRLKPFSPVVEINAPKWKTILVVKRYSFATYLPASYARLLWSYAIFWLRAYKCCYK